jgi:hypothetical protein
VVGAWSHLSMKEGSLFYFGLFCSYEIHPTTDGTLGVFGKLSTTSRGA